MARAANPAKLVEVGGVTYYWRTTPDILSLVLAVWPRNLAGARLIAVFPISKVVSTKVVRAVIEVALARRYDPRSAGPPLAVTLEPPGLRPVEPEPK